MAEQKTKLSAKEVLADLRAGATNEFLGKKYGLSQKGLSSLLEKLVAAKLISREDVETRARKQGGAVSEISAEEIQEESSPPITFATQVLYKCPSCGVDRSQEFGECLRCGVDVAKFKKQQERPTPAVRMDFKCPSCLMPQTQKYLVCPQCGIDVRKYNLKEDLELGTISRKEYQQEITKLRENFPYGDQEAKELRDKASMSSVFERVRGLAGKNAVVVGAVSLVVVVVLLGYLFYAKSEVTDFLEQHYGSPQYQMVSSGFPDNYYFTQIKLSGIRAERIKEGTPSPDMASTGVVKVVCVKFTCMVLKKQDTLPMGKNGIEIIGLASLVPQLPKTFTESPGVFRVMIYKYRSGDQVASDISGEDKCQGSNHCPGFWIQTCPFSCQE